jgi:hypothetical protein
MYTLHDFSSVFVYVFLLPCRFRPSSRFTCASYINSCMMNKLMFEYVVMYFIFNNHRL